MIRNGMLMWVAVGLLAPAAAFAQADREEQEALVLDLQQQGTGATTAVPGDAISTQSFAAPLAGNRRGRPTPPPNVDPGIEGPNHPDIESHEQLVRALNRGTLPLDDIRRRGLSVFSTPFNRLDGLGDGPFDPNETNTRAFGMRPTLQGNGQFLRVNGLDAQSCNECHSLLSAATSPPTLGLAGVGPVVTNAIIMPTLIDVADSLDDRVVFQPGHDPNLPLRFDGVADFTGRFANPPFLFGGGGVELLGKEMTLDLQQSLALARRSPAGTVVRLQTHGIDFGFLLSLGNGQIDLSGVEGVGPEHIDAVPPEAALVVRPFGRKGENFTMRDFDRGAMQFHFGIQPVEVVGAGVDADGDFLTDEVTIGEMTALHVFDVTNPPPFIGSLDPQAVQGFFTFLDIGCSDCHRPVLRTRSRSVPLATPEVPNDPTQNVYANIDLVRAGFTPDPAGGVFVPLFADLKRHDMGPRLAESLETDDPAVVGNRFFTTGRLWGIADTAPYLHDGRATTLFDAIEFHGGEAQPVRDRFVALPPRSQRALIAFLKRLKVPVRPNEELVTP